MSDDMQSDITDVNPAKITIESLTEVLELIQDGVPLDNDLKKKIIADTQLRAKFTLMTHFPFHSA